MKKTSLLWCASSMCAAIAMLAGCGGGGVDPHASASDSATAPIEKLTNLAFGTLRPIGAVPLQGRRAPDEAKKGIYVSTASETNIYGYKLKNTQNDDAMCTIPNVSGLNDIGVDKKGVLIEPDGGTDTIQLFQGSQMCGPLVGTIPDPYGQPSAAFSYNAMSGKIAVGNILDHGEGTNAPGSISICTLADGCTVNLTNPNIAMEVGVAMDKQGDCWADGIDQSNAAHLIYFAACAGGGTVATGFQNTSFGGLDIDPHGNLVTISAAAHQVYVYSGCNPACTLVGGPFPLQGGSISGHLNKVGKRLALANVVAGQVDLYQYSPTSLTYLYSFNTGLNPTYGVEDAAYNPRARTRSKE